MEHQIADANITITTWNQTMNDMVRQVFLSYYKIHADQSIPRETRPLKLFLTLYC